MFCWEKKTYQIKLNDRTIGNKQINRDKIGIRWSMNSCVGIVGNSGTIW